MTSRRLITLRKPLQSCSTACPAGRSTNRSCAQKWGSKGCLTRGGVQFHLKGRYCPKPRLPYNDVRKGACPMAHIIAEPCVGVKDTACVKVCPVDCIHPTKEEAKFETETMLYIHPDDCIDCGLCVEE